MPLTTQQAAAVKTALETAALTNSELATAIANGNDTYVQNYCNSVVSPDFWVWQDSLPLRDIYFKPSATGSFWNWGTYKSQSALEHNTWEQMFSDNVGYFSLLNFRVGILNIFGGGVGTAPGQQRVHIFACGRKLATFIQKVLATAVVSPPADTGNDSGQLIGNAANPAVMQFSETISTNDVAAILRPVGG